MSPETKYRWVCRTFPREYRPTPREVEVLWAMVTTTGTAKEISKVLGMAPNTTRTHLNNLIRKLGVHTRIEVVVWWLEIGRYQAVRRARGGETYVQLDPGGVESDSDLLRDPRVQLGSDDSSMGSVGGFSSLDIRDSSSG